MINKQQKFNIHVLPAITDVEASILASQSNSSPQVEPLIIRTQANQVACALMIESAFIQDSKLEIRGWSIGHCAFKLLANDQEIQHQLTRKIRKDVASTLAVIESDGTDSVAHDDSGNNNSVEQKLTAEGKACFDGFVGPIGMGWAFSKQAMPVTVNVFLGQAFIGKIKPGVAREDVKAAFGLDENKVGFTAMLGGVLQFSLISQGCKSLSLYRAGEPKSPLSVNLEPHQSEALTFSPLRAFHRYEGGLPLGVPRSLRFLSNLDVNLLFDIAGGDAAKETKFLLDFYQEVEPGVLTRLERFDIATIEQVINLRFKLISRSAPVLIVATDKEQTIVLTDAILVPELFHDKNLPLIDYHSMLGGGKSYFDEIAKLTRNQLDFVIKHNQMLPVADKSTPHKLNTALIIFAREDLDPIIRTEYEDYQLLSQSVFFLERDGSVQLSEQQSVAFSELVDNSDADYFLFLEAQATLRPDFWAILAQCHYKTDLSNALIYWDYLLASSIERPYLIKQPLLLNPEFRNHVLLFKNSVIVGKNLLKTALAKRASDFKSGQLRIEHAFCDTDVSQVIRIPYVMESSRIGLTIPRLKEAWENQVAIDFAPPSEEHRFQQTGGISIIINYRNSEQDTLRCLDAIRLQRFSGHLEIILVNNGSVPSIVESVYSKAIALFGFDAVKTIDYNQTFNHSRQCNLAAKLATQEFLLMLSNDSVLISSDALAMAREITAIPWVGTCSFRVIGRRNNKLSLQSLGLAANRRSDLLAGGPFLVTHLAPDFMVDTTIEVIGNTFAVVLLRRDLYLELGGLDEDIFPTNYNDVDFSLRASAQGYKHVVIGAAVVEHLGRGSREYDLDLPIEQAIFDRAPPLSALTAIGTIKL